MSMESLGGNMPAGQPVAVVSGNRTHVFAIAASGAMNHWTSVNGEPWTGPVVLPGGDTLKASFPSAIALPDGSLHVFAIVHSGPVCHGDRVTGSHGPKPRMRARRFLGTATGSRQSRRAVRGSMRSRQRRVASPGYLATHALDSDQRGDRSHVRQRVQRTRAPIRPTGQCVTRAPGLCSA